MNGTGIQERVIDKTHVVIDGRNAGISASVPKEQEHEYAFEHNEMIYTNPAGLLKTGALPSFSVIRFAKVKNFIDGVYAAIEERVHEKGHGLSRNDFLNNLERVADEEAREYIHAAIKGKTGDEPAMRVVQGFYDWNNDLREAYKQLKILARTPGYFCGKDGEFDRRVMSQIKRDIEKHPELKQCYEKLNVLYSKMTNKSAGGLCLFPAAELPDQEYFKQLSFIRMGDDLPGGLGKILVKAVREGEVNFEPGEDSGLYIWQMNEIVPLVRRDTLEFQKFVPNKEYGEILDNEFISQWAGTRHTHVGHTDFHDRLMTCCVDMREPPIEISPELQVEPFSSCYMKMGKSLGFLEEVIKQNIPEIFDRRRVLNNGDRSNKKIIEEFEEMRMLLDGLGMISSDSIHLPYQDSEKGREARKFAEKWMKNASDDSDLNRNTSIFVPIIRTKDGSRQISYIDAGFKTIDLTVNYSKAPEVKIEGTKKQDIFSRDYEFKSKSHKLPVLVHREVRIPYEKLINDRRLREMLKSEFTEKDLDNLVAKLES